MYPRDTLNPMVKLKTTLTLVGHSLRCVVPKPICKELDLREGDLLTVDLEGSRIILEKMARR
jgi:AbrB family looped-hinge helix DNA binding protein